MAAFLGEGSPLNGATPQVVATHPSMPFGPPKEGGIASS